MAVDNQQAPRQVDRSEDPPLFDLPALVALLLDGKWWVIGWTGVCLSIGLLYAFASTPIYRASTVLVPTASDQGLGVLSGALGELSGLASLGALNVGSRGLDTEEALAVLRSRQFTESFISDKNLMPVLFPDDWDADAGQWRSKDPPTLERAYRLFDKDIRSIVQDRRTGLITLNIDWRDRHQAAEWANELPERLNKEMRARAIREADALVGYLEAELEETPTVVTRDAIGRLMEAQIRQRMFANVTQEYSFRVVDKALAPDKDNRFKPNRLRVLALSAFAGAALGLLTVLMRRQFSARAVTRRADLEV